MRKELDLPRIDDSKLDEAEALIASIAAREPGTAAAELEALSALTGKLHSEVEFLEYWSWTDLDTLARLTLAPEPPCVRCAPSAARSLRVFPLTERSPGRKAIQKPWSFLPGWVSGKGNGYWPAIPLNFPGA